MDAVQKANSGHPGTPMALAPITYVLYTRVMKHNPEDPDWFDRDRFVLSAGHASMLLYSMLYLTGYGLELDDLKNFRQLGSPTAGHPEYGHAAGHRDDHRPARAGHLELRRPGAGRADVECAARRHRRPPHVHDRLRRRPPGGRRLRGVLAGRPSRPRPPDRVLRRQPHLDRGRHRAVVLGGRRQAVRGLRLARPEPRRGPRPRPDRGRDRRGEGGGGQAVADHRAHAHRARLAEQAGHGGGARRPARRGGGQAHEGGLRLADRRALPRAGGGARALPRGRRARPRARVRVEGALRRVGEGQRRARPPTSSARCAGSCRTGGTRTCPGSSRRMGPSPRARRRTR